MQKSINLLVLDVFSLISYHSSYFTLKFYPSDPHEVQREDSHVWLALLQRTSQSEYHLYVHITVTSRGSHYDGGVF